MSNKITFGNIPASKDWGLPNKDLSNIEKSEDGICPHCGRSIPQGCYEVGGELYPQLYNEVLYTNECGTTHDWEELYRCPNCKNEFKIDNGCY